MIQPQPALPLVVLTLAKHLIAMNAHTGQRVWEYEIAHYQGRLFVDQGLVLYVAGGVLCLDYLTGALRWKAQLPSKVGMGPNVLVYAGCVILTAMGEAVCLNAQTGAQLWHDTFKGYSSLSGPMAAPGVSAQLDRS